VETCASCGATTLLAGRLTLLEMLGEGGSGRTFRAFDGDAEREVALKILDISQMSDWKRLELFKRQHTILSSLTIDGVPEAYGMFEATTISGVQWCFEQELIAGDSLQSLIDRGRRFTEAEATGLFEGLLDTLAALHERCPPLIHRDIKPSNLILKPSGELVLIDFDTATGDDQSAFKRDATLVGTAGFVPLEQLAGQATPASDLYAAAMTLVALLTRRPVTDLPVEGGRVQFEDALEVSASLRYVLTRQLSPAAEERLQSAKEVKEALRAEPPARIGGALQPVIGANARRLPVSELEARHWSTNRHLAWPVDAEASSVYSSGYGVTTLVGPPRVYPRHGDIPGAWAAKLPRRGHEWIELTYAEQLPLIEALWILETNLPGAVVTVTLITADGSEETVYESPPSACAPEAVVLEVPLSPARPVKRVRVDLNTSQVGTGWNQIDTVALVAQAPVIDIPVNWALKPRMPLVRRLGYTAMVGLALWGIISGWLSLGLGHDEDEVTVAPPGPPPVTARAVDAVSGTRVEVVPGSKESVQASNIRWASSIHEWSSRYDAGGWAPESALGAPRVWPEHADVIGAWAPKHKNAGEEFIELGFSNAAPVSKILIFESFNPGAILMLEQVDGEARAPLWRADGEPPRATPGHYLSFTLREARVVRRLRLTLDTRRVRGHNEIDAVGLVSAPQP
jgi:serine/threonine protein kinase